MRDRPEAIEKVVILGLPPREAHTRAMTLEEYASVHDVRMVVLTKGIPLVLPIVPSVLRSHGLS